MLLDGTEVVVAVVVTVVVLGFIVLQLRRAVLFRRGATVAFAFRPHCDRSWQGGVARFDPDALRAYRIVGVGIRPYAEFDRAGMSVGHRRAPNELERRSLMADPIVVTISCGGNEAEMAVGAEALPGLLAWVEGRPVG